MSPNKLFVSKRKLDNLPVGSVVTFDDEQFEADKVNLTDSWRKIEDGWAKHRDAYTYQKPVTSEALASGEPFMVIFEPNPDEYMLENSSVVLYSVHKAEDCIGATCVIHKKTKHHMRHMPQTWRPDRGIMERACLHGTSHPDPDSSWPSDSAEWIHGCCGYGCCAKVKA